MELTISLAQFNVQLGDPEANYQIIRGMTAEAAARGSDLVLYPELWSTGYDLENSTRHAAPQTAGMFARMSSLAAEYKIACGGTLLEAIEHNVKNTFALYDQTGWQAALYRKIHLFQLMDEPRWLTAGNKLVLTEMAFSGRPQPVRIGLAICYDLRFPEIFRAYALQGAELILLPAEWPAARRAHWHTLLQARAIENQFFIAAVNRTGSSRGEAFAGESLIVDPWGNLVARGGESDELISARINLEAVAQVRQAIPVFADRRPEVYNQS